MGRTTGKIRSGNIGLWEVSRHTQSLLLLVCWFYEYFDTTSSPVSVASLFRFFFFFYLHGNLVTEELDTNLTHKTKPPLLLPGTCRRGSIQFGLVATQVIKTAYGRSNFTRIFLDSTFLTRKIWHATCHDTQRLDNRSMNLSFSVMNNSVGEFCATHGQPRPHMQYAWCSVSIQRCMMGHLRQAVVHRYTDTLAARHTCALISLTYSNCITLYPTNTSWIGYMNSKSSIQSYSTISQYSLILIRRRLNCLVDFHIFVSFFFSLVRTLMQCVRQS